VDEEEEEEFMRWRRMSPSSSSQQQPIQNGDDQLYTFGPKSYTNLIRVDIDFFFVDKMGMDILNHYFVKKIYFESLLNFL